MDNKPRRYSDEEKKQLLERYLSLVASGKNVVEAAKEIGVSYVTIRAWQKKDEKKVTKTKKRAAAKKARGVKKSRARAKTGRKARKPAKVMARSTGKNLAMVMPNGYRIEGFSVDELIKLLKSMK